MKGKGRYSLGKDTRIMNNESRIPGPGAYNSNY
jgi:hypothetical protein